MPETTFTKDEIWDAVMQLGAHEDLNADEISESKKQLFDVLGAVVANREEAAKDHADEGQDHAEAEGVKEEDKTTGTPGA